MSPRRRETSPEDPQEWGRELLLDGDQIPDVDPRSVSNLDYAGLMHVLRDIRRFLPDEEVTAPLRAIHRLWRRPP